MYKILLYKAFRRPKIIQFVRAFECVELVSKQNVYSRYNKQNRFLF